MYKGYSTAYLERWACSWLPCGGSSVALGTQQCAPPGAPGARMDGSCTTPPAGQTQPIHSTPWSESTAGQTQPIHSTPWSELVYFKIAINRTLE